MTEAMLLAILHATLRALRPSTAIQQGAPLKMVSIAVVYEANDAL